jgi:hypothetical protein
MEQRASKVDAVAAGNRWNKELLMVNSENEDERAAL